MALVSDRAICIRIVEYSETSQIATIFTRGRGLVRVIAKGAHRSTKAGSSRFDGGLDLLDEANALLGDRAERDLNILAEWKIIEGYRLLRRSVRAMHLGLFVAELIGEFFEAMDPHPKMYDRFRVTLSQLGTPSCEESGLAMTLDLLRDAGYLPSLTRCAVCGNSVANERSLYFSAAQGGVVCRNCEMSCPDRVSIDPRLVAIAINILKLPREEGAAMRLPRLTRAQTDPLIAVLIAHVEHVLQKRVRLKRYLMRAPGRPARHSERPATSSQHGEDGRADDSRRTSQSPLGEVPSPVVDSSHALNSSRGQLPESSIDRKVNQDAGV